MAEENNLTIVEEDLFNKSLLVIKQMAKEGLYLSSSFETNTPGEFGWFSINHISENGCRLVDIDTHLGSNKGSVMCDGAKKMYPRKLFKTWRDMV